MNTTEPKTSEQQRVIEQPSDESTERSLHIENNGFEDCDNSLHPEYGFEDDEAGTRSLLTNDVLLRKIKELETKVLKLEQRQNGHHNNHHSIALGYVHEEEPKDIYMSSFPQDSYSFIILYGFRARPRKQPLVFLFGIYVWAIQASTLALFAADLFFSGKVPANVDPNVRAAQYLAVIISVCFAGSSLNDMLEGISIFPSYNGRLVMNDAEGEGDDRKEGTEIPKYKLALSCCLRIIQGGVGMLLALFLIVQSENVFDLILNFTAVQFISELDNVAFDLTTSGLFGLDLKKESESIQDMEIPIKLSRTRLIIKWLFILIFVAFPMFYGLTYFAIQQNSNAYLCKTIRAEFGDEVSTILGYYNGCYHINPEEKFNGRVTYKSDDHGNTGKFGYCADEEVWTFFITNDPCDYAARSEETTSYTIQETSRALWFSKGGIPLDYFRLSCQDQNEDYCKLIESDPADACDSIFLVPIADNNAVSGFSDTYHVLSDGSPNKASLYGRPIFVDKNVLKEDVADKVSSVIFFTGRRWYLSDSDRLYLPRDSSGIIDFFGQDFHPSQLNGESIHLASEPVEIDNGADSPIGLSWFNVRSVEDPSDDKGSLPYADTTRRAAGSFLCARCDEVENVCNHGGQCRDDRFCQCNHGASGFLCDIKPLGDGVCDPFFNTKEEGYDGGDCCAYTCERAASCGISTVTNAFESELRHRGDGFQLCQDPWSQPITIYIPEAICPECPGNDVFCPPCNRPLLKLVCGTSPTNERIYLASVEMADFSNRSETVYIEPGAECELSVSNFESNFDSVRDWNITYEIYHGDEAVLFDLVIGDGNNYDQTLVSFPVILKCLQGILTPIISDQQKLYGGSTEAKAAKWLNADLVATDNRQCDDAPKVIEQYALASIYISAGSSSLGNGGHCQWQGIVCENEMVTELSLEGQSLNRTIAKEAGLLEHLLKPNLRDNELVGTIPPEIFAATDLEWVSLRHNLLRGTVPTEIGNLKKIIFLNLEENLLSGSIPSEIGLMTRMTTFECDGNNLHGSIPSEIGLITLLREFDLDSNRFTGSIPTEIGNMENLIEIDFKWNNLTSTLPTELGNLKKLVELELHDNALTGTLPTELAQLTSLTELLLNNNDLTGSVPLELTSLLDSLHVCRLDGNANLIGIPDNCNNVDSAATRTISPAPTVFCPEMNQFQLHLTLAVSGPEISWSIQDQDSRIIDTSPDDGYGDNDDIIERGCLEEGSYTFSLYNSFGDGLLEAGYFVWLMVGETTVLWGGADDFNDDGISISFTVPSS